MKCPHCGSVIHERDDVEELIAEFKHMRRKKGQRFAMTERAEQIFRKRLDRESKGKNEVKIYMLEKAIMNNWQTVYRPHDEEISELIGYSIEEMDEQEMTEFLKKNFHDPEIRWKCENINPELYHKIKLTLF